MAESNKLTKEQLDNLRFTELVDNMRQFAKAMDDIIPLMDLTSNSTKVTYTIELDGKLPLSSFIILSQLKVAITLGLAKVAKSLKK